MCKMIVVSIISLFLTTGCVNINVDRVFGEQIGVIK